MLEVRVQSRWQASKSLPRERYWQREQCTGFAHRVRKNAGRPGQDSNVTKHRQNDGETHQSRESGRVR